MSYLDYSGRADRLSGGARRIPVDTPSGRFSVWTKRVGNNPDLKVLLLHGGPGATHEYLEACDSFLPAAGVEYYYYDQLGSGFSDQPDDPSLWELDRFVDEVEQVRRALGLDRENFVLYGQSWGGLLALEYALAYQRAPARAGDLQHDGERARLHRVRRAGADARDGPRRARRGEGARGVRRHREPPLHGTAHAELLRAPHAADARRRLAGPGRARLRAHQPEDLRADAGAERTRDERRRQAGPLGPCCRTCRGSRCRRWSSAPATTRWTRPTWR